MVAVIPEDSETFVDDFDGDGSSMKAVSGEESQNIDTRSGTSSASSMCRRMARMPCGRRGPEACE